MDHYHMLLHLLFAHISSRCDLRVNDLECRGHTLPVVCVRVRRLKIPPIAKIRFSPERWYQRVNHGSCPSMDSPLLSYHPAYMDPDSVKHVPGTRNCQEAYLTFEHDHTTRLATATTRLGQQNCLYYPPRGYTCLNWNSPFLQEDLRQARRRHTKPLPNRYNSTYIGTSSSLAIWSSAMAAVPNAEMLSLGILMPCIGEFSYSLSHFLDKIEHHCDSCVLLHFTTFLSECGVILPLTPFRSALLRGFFTHFQRRLQSEKARDVSNSLLTRFLDSVGLVDPAIEARKLSVALSLVLSQLRHYDHEWRVNNQKIKG